MTPTDAPVPPRRIALSSSRECRMAAREGVDRRGGSPPGGPPLPEPQLELVGVRAAYDRVEVLHGIDLAVEGGSLAAVLGPNGAGKSTLLDVIAGIQPASAGEVRVGGEDVTGMDPARRARAGVCSIPEGRGVFPNLTVRENLWMVTYAGVGRREVEDRAFARFPPLAGRANQAAGQLSGGEQQMLAMARALTSDPGLLLLDELSMGLAPRIVEELYQVVRGLVADGITVLCVEQFAPTVLAVADVAAVMVQGRITAVGAPTNVAAQLAAAYLGGAANGDQAGGG
jgi:branched-chain amino acid transport system ATP-binding protein